MSARSLSCVLALALVAAALPPPSKARSEVVATPGGLTNAERTSLRERQWRTVREARAKALGACDGASVTVSHPAIVTQVVMQGGDKYRTVDVAGTDTSTVAATGWTGGCIDGRRDGPGALSLLFERGQFGFPANRLRDQTTTTGTFVQGRQVGLWCETAFSTVVWNAPRVWAPRGCQLLTGDLIQDVSAPWFAKDEAGTWRLRFGQGDAAPLVLPAGSLEAQSEQMLAVARRGADPQVRLTVTSPALDGLVAGGALPFAPAAGGLDLNAKRIGIVFSNRTVAEMKRLDAERLTLPGLAQGAPSQRAAYEANSAPAVMTAGVTAGVSRGGATAVPLDDLSALQQGQVDYVLVFDWTYQGRFDVTDKAYARMRACVQGAPAQTCPVLFAQRATAYLIGRDLTIRRIWGLRGADHFKETDYADPGGAVLHDYITTFALAFGWEAGRPGEIKDRLFDAFAVEGS